MIGWVGLTGEECESLRQRGGCAECGGRVWCPACEDRHEANVTAVESLIVRHIAAAMSAAAEVVQAALDPGELDCGRLGRTCTEVHSGADRWCRACRIAVAIDDMTEVE